MGDEDRCEMAMFSRQLVILLLVFVLKRVITVCSPLLHHYLSERCLKRHRREVSLVWTGNRNVDGIGGSPKSATTAHSISIVHSRPGNAKVDGNSNNLVEVVDNEMAAPRTNSPADAMQGP